MCTNYFQELFQIKCLIEDIDIRLSCRIENGVKQLLALITNDGDLVFHYTYGELPAVIKRIPWFTDSGKHVQAICFDPTATWLLAISVDGSIYIIPALSLVDKKQKIDCKWSVNDITHFPKHTQSPDSKPSSVVWWQTFDCNQNALLGYENGAISLISLTDGRCLGTCTINEAVTKLHLCQDNSLDCVSLLINGESGQQWRLILEQHSTSYIWPSDTNINLNDDSTRSRLFSLKQMSVDKLVALKQRLTESRVTRRDSQASDTDSSHSESSHSGPELLPHLCDTFFAPQYARNRYLFSAFYKPTGLLTVHAVDVESAPLYIYKLSDMVDSLLLTDRLIYCINHELSILSIISTQMAECRLDGDTEFNPESMVAQFNVRRDVNERILNIYKLTDLSSIRRHKEDHKRENKNYNLPKSFQELNLRKPKIDTCVVVTSTAVYKIILSYSPVHKFVQLVTDEWKLEKADRLAFVFGLNLQQLLENCGDLLISSGSYHQGLVLYKQAKIHLLKRVLKLGISGDCRALLKFINLCLSASKMDMSMATKIHMGNLAVMAYTELMLRYNGHLRVTNTENFMKFLRYEEYYDQILAVNVACQAGRWNIVTLLAKSRGLQPDVVAALSQVLQATRTPSLNDRQFLITLSEPSLTQSLLIYPSFSHIILSYVRNNLHAFPSDILQRFVIQLDPSQPAALPVISKLFLKSKISSSIESTLDSVDFDTPERMNLTSKDFIETFICVLIHLIAKSDNNEYDKKLLDKVNLPERREELQQLENFPDFHLLSCGYEHAAIVRNGSVYTMGIANSGCLGLGPLLTHSSPPKLVQTFSDLKLRVLSVSCGRKHTLALTEFGVYGWGSNSYGQLGLGPLIQENSYPEIIPNLSSTKIVDAIAGQYHSMALTSGGKVYTWGWGIHGQLGHGTSNNEYYPKLLDFQQVVVQIAAGHAHSLILTNDGKLYGFGSNAFGQLEKCNLDGTKTTKPVWVLVVPDMYTPIVKIATAYFHNIVARADHEVYTWGASPQEVRISQSKHAQKLIGIDGKTFEPWKTSTRIYTSIDQKPVEKVAVGFRHSVVLHKGKLHIGRNMEEELNTLRINEHDNASIFEHKFTHVSCGPDYVLAMDHAGKVLAWGSNTMAQTLLGRSQDDDQKHLDGRVLVFKNTKRIIKIPQNVSSNSDNFPIEVPGIPTLAITFSPPDHKLIMNKNFVPYAIRSVENQQIFEMDATYKRKNGVISSIEKMPSFKFSHKTLHYVLETYYGYYDTESILSKCLEVNNYQAASKIAFLDGHFSDSLGFQLAAFKNYMAHFVVDFHLELTKSISSDKIHHSPAHILSSSSSLDSIQQWGDDFENQGGCESPCHMSEIDIRQTMTQYVHSVKNNQSSPISSVSKLVTENNFEKRVNKDEDLIIKDEKTKEIIGTAACIVEFYIQKTYTSENHILMQNILMKCIEFWLSNGLPIPVLESVLLKNMDKYFYPLSILLFCKNFNNNLGEEIVKEDKQQQSAGFLKEFSTKFCLQLCYMVLENVNKA